jgi:DNA-binding winged helix-turn-helix (wHTH) protein/TolB-like protein
MHPSTWRFGDFEFDPLAGELRRGTTSTRLEPQPARVLAVLVERAGDVVSREELQQRVWSGDTFVDFERGLNYCIAQIRAALGDSASDPQFVETLPRRGYRFIAAVRHGGAPATTARAWRGRAAAAAVLALALTGAISWRLVARHGAAGPARLVDDRVRIAVVPFDNETDVASYDRLAQTLTDATVARLAGDPDRLAVVGNAAVLRGPRKFRDVGAIGRALGVSHVILGQVQEIGGQLRVTTHLIRVGDQAHVWAHRFEPSAAGAATLDREVSDAVVAAVTGRLLGR